MADNPSGHSLTPTAAGNMVSMFQSDSVAIRCTLAYGLARFKAGSVGRITGVNW